MMPFEGFPTKPGDIPALDEITSLRAEVERLSRELERERALPARAEASKQLEAVGIMFDHEGELEQLAQDAINAETERDALKAEVERLTRERDEALSFRDNAWELYKTEEARAVAAERKLEMVHELVIATSKLIALFPIDIDERKAGIIHRARVAISELERETITDPDDCNPSDYT